MTISIDVACHLGSFELSRKFEVPAGFTVITGPSGSGKTTLLNIISGLIKPEHGYISVDGEVLLDRSRGICLPAHKRKIGYVFQEARLFPHLSVRHNLSYGSWFSGRLASHLPIEDIADMLGIRHLLKRSPNNLSGGEKQRVAIGRALLTSPRLLLMDEPLSALDRHRKDEIVPYLEKLHQETGIPILYTTHNPDEVGHLMTSHIDLS